MHQNACSKMPLEMGWQHWWCLKEGEAMQEEDKQTPEGSTGGRGTRSKLRSIEVKV